VAGENLLETPLITRETVAMDTPARAATSAIDTGPFEGGSALSCGGKVLGMWLGWRIRVSNYCQSTATMLK
jgi:hypothetical protein